MPPQEKLPCPGPEDHNLRSVENCTNCTCPQRGGLECLQCTNGHLNQAYEHEKTDVTNERLHTIDLQDKCQPAPFLQHPPSLSPEKPPPLPHEEPSEDLMDFDDLLPYVGEFGFYQKCLFLFMIPFAFFVAFVYFSQIFMSIAPEIHWCQVPELINANLTVEQRMYLSIPKSEDGSYDKCTQYGVNFTDVLSKNITEPNLKWPVIPCQSGWEYNFTDVPYNTIATELNWVCEQAALPNVAQSIFFVGAIFGGLIFGWLADRFGRIPALVGTNVLGAVAGIATAFVNSFWGFCFFRFLVGFAFDNCFVMMYILVLEYVGPKWRTFVANMSIALFFTLAACLLPWIAIYVGDWRMFTIVTSAPLLLAIFTPWIVPESARWLLSQGKVDEAITTLRKFEKMNGTHIDEKLYEKFRDDSIQQYKNESDGKTYSVLDLFSSPRLRKITILFIIIWMAISLVFDGHVRNVGALGLDVFLTFTIASATEMPADTFLTLVLDRWGRRWLACGSMVLSGVFSLLATCVPSGIPSATLAILGRFAVNISYNIGLQYAAEVLPTVVRAQGVALIHIMGYVASILAPFIVYLSYISPMLPLIILGVLGIIGGVLCLFLPETLDQELPQTLEDGENFGLNQKLMDMPCRSRRNDDEAKIKPFKRSSPITSSIRASIRGETYRSSMIVRESIRNRKIQTPEV